MKKILFSILCICGTAVFAQNEEDVFRYSNLQYGGTARYNSVAGAFGALGADFSVLATNPAGMGRFRQSDFSFTPSVNLSSNTSSFKGVNYLESKENLNINQIGIVGVIKSPEESFSNWQAVQFGFGYNKLANFNTRFTIDGINDRSYSSVLANQGYGLTWEELPDYSPFGASVAYEGWLIDPALGPNGENIFTTQMYGDSIAQFHTTTQGGGTGEWNLAVAANYADRLYIGGTVGFARINFRQEKVHTETSLVDTSSLVSFTYTENLQTKGNGINLKLGAIFLPTKWLRLGFAYHTPTSYYSMTDEWTTEITTSFRDVDTNRTDYSYTASSPEGRFLYKMRTPSRVIGSASFVIKKKGLISIDYERSDYTRGILKSHPESGDNYAFTDENSRVKENFKSVNIIRAGAEFRLTNLLMLRAGAAYYQNGYQDSVVSETPPRITYSAGLGYRASSFYVDVAYSITQTSEDYYMYDPLLVENSRITKSISNIFATVGFKF